MPEQTCVFFYIPTDRPTDTLVNVRPPPTDRPTPSAPERPADHRPDPTDRPDRRAPRSRPLRRADPTDRPSLEPPADVQSKINFAPPHLEQ